MRRALLVLVVALTVLATFPTSAAAATGTLDIRVRGTGTNVTGSGPNGQVIDMYLIGDGRRRCKSSGANNVPVESTAFTPQSEDEDTNANGLLVHSTTITNTPGTYKVTATCTGRGWTFVGYIRVVSGDLPFGGVALHPTATLGLTFILVGGLLLVVGRRRRPTTEGVGHPAGRSSQVRR
jgi:hypothetical protein